MGKKLMYLRKSRADDPNETVEEVLAKHYIMLQEFAQREYGEVIPEEGIYREVVSGESIDARVEINKLLARIEDPDVELVLVVDPQRLSRGDLEDCGRLVNKLRYSYTRVTTLRDTFDLNNKRDRRYFQDELLRGNDYLEYYKEILRRGREAAVKRGCYINSKAPYGYDRVKKGDDWTLEPNANADMVCWIFDQYARKGTTVGRIAALLNERGLESPGKSEVWTRDTVYSILKNIHYTGKVRYNHYQKITVMENGQRKRKIIELPDDHEDVIITEGLHDALISRETWELSEAKRKQSAAHAVRGTELVNAFAGLVRCTKCGKMLVLNSYKNQKRLECRKYPRCSRRVQYARLYDAILYALENAELPNLEAKLANGDGDAAKIQRKLLQRLEKQMEEYKEQEERQYDMLETGRYTPDIFDKRHAALRAKMENCQKQIYETRTNLPEEVDFEERIVCLKDAIAALKDPTATPKQMNDLLKAIVDRIDCTVQEDGHSWGKTNFKLDVYLKF